MTSATPPAQIKIYTDEDVTNSIANALKRRGLKAYTTPEKNNRGLKDREQIEAATNMKASLLTHNLADFPRIHYELMEEGISHFGIIVAKQTSIGEIVRGVLRIADEFNRNEMRNRLEYLSNWT